MRKMGRPRGKDKDMPPGLRQVAGRWYWRPTNAAGRDICARLAPGKTSMFAGETKADARKWWVKTIMAQLDAMEGSADDTVGSIIDAYFISPQYLELAEKTRKDYKAWLEQIRDRFGTARYAKSEADAVRGDYLRRMHIAQMLDDARLEGKGPTGNRKKAALSSAFRAAIRTGKTEYNPCDGVESNPEQARSRLPTHTDYAKLRRVAQPVIRLSLLIARLTAMREGDILRMQWSWIKNGEIHVTPSKTEKRARKTLRIAITPSLAKVLAACKQLRGNLRSTHVIHNGRGQPYTQDGFQSLWQRTVKKSGVEDLHFHDFKARAVTDKERKEPGQATILAAHSSPEITRKVYLRGGQKVGPVR